MAQKKNPTLNLTRAEAVTAHFGMVNYIAQLKQEIKTPTGAHGAAESAMALADAQPLSDRIKTWLEENPR